MDQKNGFMGLSAEEIQKIARSAQAKELLQRLNQGGGEVLKKASDAAKKGDYDALKTLIEPIMRDKKTAELVEQLAKKQGRNG